MIDRKTRRDNNSSRRAKEFMTDNRIYKCTKYRYTDAQAAWSGVEKAYLKGRSEKAVYYCDMCSGYHLTSSESAFVGEKQWKPGQAA